MAQDDAAWLAKSPALREKLIAVGLVGPEPIPKKVIIPTLEAVDKLMKKANPVWQVILGLSRYPVFLNHRTHRTHGNKSSHRYVIFRWFRRVPWFLPWDWLPACPLLHDVWFGDANGNRPFHPEA
jgi:hypothetical protein